LKEGLEKDKKDKGERRKEKKRYLDKKITGDLEKLPV
jgi:hypothetical protein